MREDGVSSTPNAEQKVADINYGDVIKVDVGNEPDWWQDNWYKILTAAGVVAGIAVALGR